MRIALAGLAALAAATLAGLAPARAAACTDLALGRAEARPFESIPFPETVDALLVSVDGAEPLRLPLAAGTFVVPPHPVTPLEGGVVELAADVDGSCPLGDLTIAALPPATGAVAREAADLAGTIADIRALSIGDASLPSIETAPDALVPLALLVAMGEAVAADLASLSGDPLTEALFAAASAQTRARVPRRRADAPPVSPRRHARALVSRFAEIVAGLSPIGAARAVELPLDTTGLLCPEDAESLRRMAWMQIAGEAASLPEVSRYLEAANGLLGLGALAATATRNERLATALGAYAAYNTTRLMAYGYADNLFPSRAQRLQIETTRRRFMEDSDPDGAITAIRIVPANKGWALDKLALDLMGAAVQVGVPSETFGELVGWAAFAEISTRATQRGVSRIRIPAQTFCAVDISDPAHHRIHVMDAANAPFVRSGALGYRARATGEATLYVSSEPSFFGNVFAAELVRLSVEPIRVFVSPGSSTVAPGQRVRLWASVTGAEDPTLDWVLEGGAADLAPIGAQALSVDVTTGVAEASFPIRLRATPRTRTGLRGLPDAPARDGFGVIETALPRIAASPLCLEPGETHRFEAVWPATARTLTIFADGAVDAGSAAALRPVWTASAGRIDATGLYTAPDARGRDVTITLADAAAPALTTSRRIRVGNCTCFWEVSLGGQRFSGYWTYFPVVLDSRFDRGGDGVLDLFPMADNRFGPKDEPVTSELRLQTLLVNYPRSEPGPSLTLTFDPPIDGRRGGTSRMSGGMSAETTPGLRTDPTRLYAFTGNIGADAVYVLGRDSVDMEIAAEFTRFADGEPVDRRLAVVRLRARAGYGPASACEGPDAPLPRLPIGDALPSLPTLPRVDR